MKKRELVTKILAGLLVAGMLIGLLPMFASAAETDPVDENQEGTTTEEQGDLHMSKTAVLQDDGTYTITLEAYATGTVETEVRTQVIPTDIILVLDQSGSMVENEDIEYGVGTYSVVTDLPTNEQMVSGEYYYFDANDQKYYRITTTRNIVHENSHWVYSDSIERDDSGNITAYETVCLESEENGVIGKSWTAGSSTVNFDTGTGYLLSQYLKYQRTGSGQNYGYSLVTAEGIENAVQTPVSGERSNRVFSALEGYIEETYPDMTVVSSRSGGPGGSYYALAYVPVELVNADVYYYTYTYVDDMGQTWTIGHSAEDNGIGTIVADQEYDAKNLGKIYTEISGEVSRLYALQQAATTFVNDMQAAAVAHNVDHRIAVVGFSGSDYTANGYSNYRYLNSELFIGATQYNYTSVTNENYQNAFQSVKTTAGYNNLVASIGALDGNGPTYPSVGFRLAAGVASANAGEADANGKNAYTRGDRKLVVIFMTDGVPGWNSFEDDEADETVTLAGNLKSNYDAKVYTLALLGKDFNASSNRDEDEFLKAVSSDGSYTLATTGVGMDTFFSSVEISVDTHYSTVTLSENAFLVDRVSEYFEMPEGITATNLKDHVSIYTADHLGGHTFGIWTPVEYAVATDAAGESELPADKVHVWLTYGATDEEVHGITVHNFDYLSTANMVTTKDDGEPSGRKLIVVIKGITPKSDGALDYYIPTNNDHSGLWDLAENGTYGKLKGFPIPHTMIVNRIYVLDYAKNARLTSLDKTRIPLSLSSAKNGSLRLNKDASGNVIYQTELSISEESGLKFGNAYIEDSHLYYTPMTTNWYGYDTFNVFWQASNYDAEGNFYSEGDPVTGYGWSQVNVMPANNVYYEDTFVTTSTDDTTATGRVGIEFGTGWSFTTVDSSGDPVEGGNTETPESAGQGETVGTHGWVETLADDTGFTDGTVAVGDGSAKATATFTFTGTGMDLYSYTDKTTGTVLVKVEPIQVSEGYKVPTRYFIVDNYAASDEYYSIPTVSYSARGTDAEGNEALVYGQYKVTITVTTAAASDGGRVTYYLDGIRVYNPLGTEQENNPTVSEGYGDEVHAFFYNIRDYLIDANTFDAQGQNGGAVFIDQIKKDQVEGEEVGEGVETEAVGTYEDYGPKNEVYLAADQMITMKVDLVEGRRFFVSMKSPTGAATTAEISNGDAKSTVRVNHTADLYYEVVPAKIDETTGYICIKNTGEALLSLTKYQITGLDPNPHDGLDNSTGDETDPDPDPGAGVQQISNEEAVTYARTFALMRSVPYAPNSSDAGTDTEEQTPAEPEVPEIEITNPEVEPEPETPDEPSPEEQAIAMVKALVDRLFQSVLDWFNA